MTFSLFRNLVFILLAVLKPRSHEADDTGITAIIESSLLIWGNKSPYLVTSLNQLGITFVWECSKRELLKQDKL